MNGQVSVIIRNWNRREDLRETLNKLKNEAYKPIEIIVVDNGSTDQSVMMVQEEFPIVKLVELPKNVGVAATNIGVNCSKGEYILCLDNDATPISGSIDLAVESFRRNKNLGIIACKICSTQQKDFHGQERIEAGKKKGKCENGIPVKTFIGCGAVIRRNLLERIGGYPEEFFMYGEESDLALRTIGAGFEVRYFPNIQIIHRQSSKSRLLKKKYYYTARNTIWLFWKYSPFFSAISKTVCFISTFGVKALKDMSLGDYFYGVRDGLSRAGFLYRHRQVIYTQTLTFAIRNYFRKEIS